MNKYWISQVDKNWVLWAHEFSKHATCYSTFQKECFVRATLEHPPSTVVLTPEQGPKAEEHEDLFTYFETAISYFRTLPTWSWLTAASIQPSNTTAYTLSDIQDALTHGYGVIPYLGCTGPKYNETKAGAGSDDNGRTQLSEVWYYYHVYGAPQRSQAKRVPADVAGGKVSGCAKAKGAIWYYERSKDSEA